MENSSNFLPYISKSFSVPDLGFSTQACMDASAKEGDRFPIAGDDEVQDGVDPERYFYVCVKESYVKKSGEDVLHCPTGYLGARLLGCPVGQKFNAETKQCV